MEQLKSNITSTQLAILVDTLEEVKNNVIKLYNEIRQLVTPSSDIRRRVDARKAVTTDLIKIAYERIAGIDEFDAERERKRLHTLLD